jgi:DNA repair protein RadC
MSQRIQDLPSDDRPRERLLRLGPAALSNAELLGIFINTGIPGENAVQIGQRLLSQSHNLRLLSRREPMDLARQLGLGPAKAAIIAAAFELGRRAAREEVVDIPLDDPQLIFDYMASEMHALSREEVHVLMLNSKCCLTHHVRLYKGTVNESPALAREVLAAALTHNAIGIILVHNHPSGDPTPSDADKHFTRALLDGGKLLRIRILDHVIIGQPCAGRASPYYSFCAGGWNTLTATVS